MEVKHYCANCHSITDKNNMYNYSKHSPQINAVRKIRIRKKTLLKQICKFSHIGNSIKFQAHSYSENTHSTQLTNAQ